MLQQISCSSLMALSFAIGANAQDANYTMVFSSREYRAVGRSYPQLWSMTLPDRKKARPSTGQCTPQKIRNEPLPANVRLPDKSDHWNYLSSVSSSPDGKLLLIGSEAGSSTSHFEEYWLFDRGSEKWRYAGGGNEAKWSPDGSKILWSTPRSLARLGKIRVWVAHLVLLDVRTLEQQTLTSGVSNESDFFWCALRPNG